MSQGQEWLVDARGCDPARVADLETLRGLFAQVIAHVGLTPVAEPVWHVFPAPGGITGLVPLAESHLTVHTFPEYGSLSLNLFCCRPCAEFPWAEHLRAAVGAAEVDVRRLDRRYAPDGSTPPRWHPSGIPSTSLAH